MFVTRRHLIGGLAAAPIALQSTALFAASSATASAIDAIRAYAEVHRRRVGVPAITVGLTTPDAPVTEIVLGTANPETLFQVGSISKLMVAAVAHQLAAEGKLSLAADVRTLLPGAPWPATRPITRHHLLDHVSRLPGDAPIVPEDGPLWIGFAPGTHWLYSNTGYDLLGKIIERADGATLASILHRRLFAPLGMSRTRGAILSADRARYAQGFEPIDRDGLFLLGDPLKPAPWVDVTFGAGSVASTGADIARLLRALAGAANGKGGLGLSPAAGRAFTGHDVAAEEGMRYGNGLEHVVDGGVALLHHTGGMPSFSSAFHLDPISGIGAFASVPVGFPAGYRPRALTLFAVQALRAAAAGRPLPTPPSLDRPPTEAGDRVGRYVSADGDISITADNGMTLVAGQGRGKMIGFAGERYGTQLAGWSRWPFRFVREGGKVVAVEHGGRTFVRAGARYAAAKSDPALARLAGRFESDSPWVGIADVVERNGQLWFGGIGRLTPIGDKLFRLGDDWSPERLRFADFLDGRPMTLYLSGAKLERRDI